MVSPFPMQWSGNSLSRKARTREGKWSGAPPDCKTVPIGAWHRAVFIITSELSPFTIGKRRPILWPLHSPDLTPLDIFFWVLLNDTVNREVQSSDQLRDRIVRAAERVNNEMLANTWWETECRLNVCRATNGAILRSAEYITNLWGPMIGNVSTCPIHFMVEGIWCFTLLSF
jgi:hypothetical protein